MEWLEGMEESIYRISNGEAFKVINEAGANGYNLVVDEVIDLDSEKTTYEIEVFKNNEVIFKVEI